MNIAGFAKNLSDDLFLCFTFYNAMWTSGSQPVRLK